MNDIMVYLKTTETCNLNCSHCFTNGINGRKIYFNPEKTIKWLESLKVGLPHMESLHVEFHGGEPFLAPIKNMQRVYDEVNPLFDNISWGATSNLVFKIDDEKLNFMRTVLNKRIGTSWDPKIRFANEKQSHRTRETAQELER